MKSFTYVVKDPEGIHARPATQLVQHAAKFKTTKITVNYNGKKVDCKGIFGMMSLGAKQGASLTFDFDGPEEDVAYDTMKKFVEENF